MLHINTNLTADDHERIALSLEQMMDKPDTDPGVVAARALVIGLTLEGLMAEAQDRVNVGGWPAAESLDATIALASHAADLAAMMTLFHESF